MWIKFYINFMLNHSCHKTHKFGWFIQSSWCTSANDHDTRDPAQSRLAVTEHSMRGTLSNMQNTNQLSSVSCPSVSSALFISIHSWDSTRAVMAMIVKSIRNILLKVRLYPSKPDHCGIEASVIDTML